ncbi:SRPBCC domain-containing protein [Streptomyces sp. DH37]|uniref:SRPBCC domain-containing protein n=1 Tax=Streptomyces sp. DH37 TaxID=3040122 RepID=UPI0024421BAD|nr:SRPBCC domain-containing protein [Streptomyces sp. DH37]MDG9702465.1 SRPBCC domain-containing protein [Streptomyces sp. DH37]
MEHEVYVPFTVGAVRAALAEPERVARCVPGLQPDASGAVPDGAGDGVSLEGRLRVRIGGSSITYRGSLRLTHEEDGGDGTYTVHGEGAEARGGGSVELTLTVVPRPADDGEGTTLACAGELSGEGRITEFEEKQRLTAGRRLLDRFGGELAASMAADPVSPVDAAGTVAAPGGIGEPDDNEPVIPGIPAPDTPGSAEARNAGNAGNAGNTGKTGTTGKADEPEPGGETRARGVFGAEIPPPSLDPASDAAYDAEFDAEFDTGLDAEFDGGPGEGLGDSLGDLADLTEEAADDEGFTDEFGEEAAGDLGDDLGDDLDGGLGEDLVDELDEESRSAGAEAAHARRTMIGRSAEEVDHAPPRGRYAPVPPPESGSPAAAVLRWAAPAAALVVASAVVVGRVLRRRR